MAKKEFMYRGKTLAELKALSLTEFMELLPSRKRRSLKRGFTDEEKILLKNLEHSNSVKTHVRELVILPSMVGKTLLVYNGKTYVQVVITEEMIAHTLGDYSLTRNKVAHSSPGVGATKSSSSVSVR